MRSVLKFVAFFICAAVSSNVVFSLRTCTVIAPEFIHSARKYSVSVFVNNGNDSSMLDLTIESRHFKESRAIDVQPDSVQIVEFNLPPLPRDEYILRVTGEKGIHVQLSTLLKYATYQPIFAIQTDKYLYQRGETLHYRILCMDENLRPQIPEGLVEIKIMTQNHRVVHYKKSSKLQHYVIIGEFYLNNFEAFGSTTMSHYSARLTISVNGEVIESKTFQIDNNDIELLSESDQLEMICEQHENGRNLVTTVNKNASSENSFTVKQVHTSRDRVLKLENVATFVINSGRPFKHLIYTIIGRGNIINSERIKLQKEEMEYTLKLKPNNRMAPLSKLVVYSIDENNDFLYDEILFNVEGMLENTIILTTPRPIMPNRKLELNITTARNSYVGLLGIEETNKDPNCANDDNDISHHDLMTNFGGKSLRRGEITGCIILTTAYKQNNKKRKYQKTWIEESLDLFELRPTKWLKTWLFAEVYNTSSDIVIVPHNLPNDDVTFRITAFALHPEGGLGFTKLEPPIRTRKLYNVTSNLPEFIYQNETIVIPLRIDNFLNEELLVRVELTQKDHDVEILPIYKDDFDTTQYIVVPQKYHTIIKYPIRSKGTGIKTLKFLFFSLAGDDRKVISLKVKPKGVSHIDNQIFFIDLKNSSPYYKQVWPIIAFDQNTMGEHPTLTTYANLMEPIMESLNNNFDDQTAEQATSTMAIACICLRSLEMTHNQNPELEIHLQRSMHKAFLSLLDYRDFKNGFFNYFLQSKFKIGSIWLTAYVSVWLSCARKFIDVDETIIETALDYLASSQNENGSFQENGIIINNSVDNNTLAMTGHVLLALFEYPVYYTKYKAVLEKGVKYIVENMAKTESLYAKAISTYALYKAGLHDLNKELNRLDESAWTKDDYKVWTQGSEINLNNIAATAFVLLTALGVSDNFEEFYGKACKWLIEQGGMYNWENRGLYPTQANVLTLDFMTKFLLRFDKPTKADVTVAYRGMFEMKFEEFEVREKRFKKKFLRLHNHLGGLEINANGQGYILTKVAFNYHVVKEDNRPSFDISIEKSSQGYLVSFAMTVCTKYTGIKETADLTILEVNMPTGYVIEAEKLQQIIANEPLVMHARINSYGSRIEFYLQGLGRDDLHCISIEPSRIYMIANQVSVPVLCYEYTDMRNMATAFYDIELNTCDLCEGEANCINNCHNKKDLW